MSTTFKQEFLRGTAGSLILGCDVCGAERFREHASPYETCWTCGPEKVLQPIRLDEMETKWKPLWRSLGIQVAGDPCKVCGEPWSHEHEANAHSG